MHCVEPIELLKSEELLLKLNFQQPHRLKFGFERCKIVIFHVIDSAVRLKVIIVSVREDGKMNAFLSALTSLRI
jgi:hypothetical protein